MPPVPKCARGKSAFYPLHFGLQVGFSLEKAEGKAESSLSVSRGAVRKKRTNSVAGSVVTR